MKPSSNQQNEDSNDSDDDGGTQEESDVEQSGRKWKATEDDDGGDNGGDDGGDDEDEGGGKDTGMSEMTTKKKKKAPPQPTGLKPKTPRVKIAICKWVKATWVQLYHVLKSDAQHACIPKTTPNNYFFLELKKRKRIQLLSFATWTEMQ